MPSYGSLPPTTRRIGRAIAEGDVPYSRAVVAAGSILGAIIAAPYTVSAVRDGFRAALDGALAGAGVNPTAEPAPVGVSAEAMALPLTEALLGAAGAALPMVFGATAGALLGTLIQYRRGTSAMPKQQRRRAPHDELARRLVRPLLCLATLGGSTLWLAATGMNAMTRSPATWLHLSSERIESVAWCGLAAAVIVAGADAWFAFAAWRKRLLMTPAELRTEEREVYGPPELRQARSRARREVGRR